MKNIIVIVGPTGVGKTKLSVELAKRLDGEVINADSMQVYKHLDIGTAKPTKKEQEGVRHHLFDFKEVDANYSVFDYQKDARRIIDQLKTKKKQIIMVGGTGLYIKAALFDYKFSEGTINHSYDDLSNEELLEKINSYPYLFKEHVNNRKRLIRMLNKLENNELISNNKNKCLYPIKIIGLTTSREYLYERINQRVDDMIKNGLVEEVSKYKEYLLEYKSLQTGIGYKEFVDYFNKQASLEETVNKIKKNSRHYAKRQYTFFNHQLDVKWFDVNFNHFDHTVNQVIEYISEK